MRERCSFQTCKRNRIDNEMEYKRRRWKAERFLATSGHAYADAQFIFKTLSVFMDGWILRKRNISSSFYIRPWPQSSQPICALSLPTECCVRWPIGLAKEEPAAKKRSGGRTAMDPIFHFGHRPFILACPSHLQTLWNKFRDIHPSALCHELDYNSIGLFKIFYMAYYYTIALCT